MSAYGRCPLVEVQLYITKLQKYDKITKLQYYKIHCLNFVFDVTMRFLSCFSSHSKQRNAFLFCSANTAIRGES